MFLALNHMMETLAALYFTALEDKRSWEIDKIMIVRKRKGLRL